MSLINKKCIEYHDTRVMCVAKENGKVYRLVNQSGLRIRKVKVDKCITQKVGEKRCDYLMNIEADNSVVSTMFIELKGSSLTDAVEQIHDTIVYLKAEHKGSILNARIVGSNDVPDLEVTPAYRKLARVVLPSKGTIKRGTNNIYSENI